MPPYLVKCFFLIFQGIFSFISQMNKPRGWTFLCIWYENSWFRVYEVKRLCFPLYMAFRMPFHLRQRTSRVYQDHLHFCRVLTSFVPPVHNQGVSLAPLQGHALWKIFLPTTGSFFVLSLTDLFCMIPEPAPCGGRFPRPFLIHFSFPVTAESSSQQSLQKTQFNRDRVLPAFWLLFDCYAACICGLLMSPISFSAS